MVFCYYAYTVISWEYFDTQPSLKPRFHIIVTIVWITLNGSSDLSDPSDFGDPSDPSDLKPGFHKALSVFSSLSGCVSCL